MNSLFFQPLEGRTMLSATGTEPSPQLAADYAQYQADIQQYKNDAALMSSTLASDRATVAADQKAICDAKKAAKADLDADKKAMLAALKADGEAGTPTYLNWKAVLDADKAAVKADRDNKDQRASDQAKLEADYKAFRDEMAPFEAQTHADIEKWNAILAADKKDCQTGGDSDLVTKLKTDQAMLKEHEMYFKKLLCTDQKKINADIAQMKEDGGGDHKDGDKGRK